MSRIVVCDMCGATDDWRSGAPFFPSGVLLQFRRHNGNPEIECELEICPECKEKLLNKYPKLKKALERKL